MSSHPNETAKVLIRTFNRLLSEHAPDDQIVNVMDGLLDQLGAELEQAPDRIQDLERALTDILVAAERMPNGAGGSVMDFALERARSIL